MTPEDYQDILRRQGLCAELSPDRQRACAQRGEHTHDWDVIDVRSPFLPTPKPVHTDTVDFWRGEAARLAAKLQEYQERDGLLVSLAASRKECGDLRALMPTADERADLTALRAWLIRYCDLGEHGHDDHDNAIDYLERLLGMGTP